MKECIEEATKKAKIKRREKENDCTFLPSNKL
jgi:hypothetical protein